MKEDRCLSCRVKRFAWSIESLSEKLIWTWSHDTPATAFKKQIQSPKKSAECKTNSAQLLQMIKDGIVHKHAQIKLDPPKNFSSMLTTIRLVLKTKMFFWKYSWLYNLKNKTGHGSKCKICPCFLKDRYDNGWGMASQSKDNDSFDVNLPPVRW
jgi:hypothetical protein